MAPKKKKSTSTKNKGKKVSARKKSVAKKPAKKKTLSRKPAARKAVAKKKSVSSKRKSVKTKARKRPAAKKAKAFKSKVSASKISGINGHGIPGLNYRTLELEISRLTELLQTIRRKNKLVKKSLAYLEKEQRKVAKQIRDAKKYLTRLKNRGIKAIRGFPDNAEEIFYQLKGEITRISKRLGIG